MINPKYIIVSSLVGLLLSFIICLFSRIAAPALVLRPLIFAVVFAALSLIIQILSNKFLAVSDYSGAKPSAATGNVINISVGDDNLPGEDVAPKFSVSNNRSGLGSGDLSMYSKQDSESNTAQNSESAVAAQPASKESDDSGSSDEAATGFKPVDLGTVTKKSDSLDELPDMGEIASVVPSGSSESLSSLTGSDSSFSGSSGSSSTAAGSSKDAELMAKAISTLLANDN